MQLDNWTRCDLPWQSTEVEVSPGVLKSQQRHPSSVATNFSQRASDSARMAIFCLILLLTFATFAEAQFRILEASGGDPDASPVASTSGSRLLEIRVLSPHQPPPRTRKIHSRPEDNDASGIVRIFVQQADGGAAKKPSKPPSNREKYRGYKSKCKCERIWKCQKMQQSIARCPPDHFMCCS